MKLKFNLENKNYICSVINTPIGKLKYYIYDELVQYIGFLNEDSDNKDITLINNNSINYNPVEIDISKSLEDQINKYFKGNLKKFNIPISLNLSSSVPYSCSTSTILIYKKLLKIPYGNLISYKKLGEEAGKNSHHRLAARVASMNKISIIIPCHRVIKSNGEYGDYHWSYSRKKWLIEHERKYLN